MPSEKVLAEKRRQVEEITAKLKESAATVLVDYRGLNVAQVTELRKKLREAGVEFKVLKNTLVSRAANNAELPDLNPLLTGPTAVAFSKEDVVAPAKVLSEFAKENEALKIKGGVVEGRFADVKQIEALAKLPSREALLSMLLSVLQAPVRNFALAVKAVADKQQNAESA